MDMRRAASALLGYVVVGAVSAGLGALAAFGWMQHAQQPGATPVAIVADAAAAESIPAPGVDFAATMPKHAPPLREDFRPTAWPLADGGFLKQTTDADSNACVITRVGGDGELRWRQRMPTRCVVYDVDAAGNAWLHGDGWYRLAADGSARRVEDLRRAMLTPAAYDPDGIDFRATPVRRAETPADDR